MANTVEGSGSVTMWRSCDHTNNSFLITSSDRYCLPLLSNNQLQLSLGITARSHQNYSSCLGKGKSSWSKCPQILSLQKFRIKNRNKSQYVFLTRHFPCQEFFPEEFPLEVIQMSLTATCWYQTSIQILPLTPLILHLYPYPWWICLHVYHISRKLSPYFEAFPLKLGWCLIFETLVLP